MMELTELIERVKELSDADKSVEVAIVELFDGAQAAYEHSVLDIAKHRYLSSIDAALAFAERVLPEGTDVKLRMNIRGKYNHVELEDVEIAEGEFEDVAAYNMPTLPLAIILATLKAEAGDAE